MKAYDFECACTDSKPKTLPGPALSTSIVRWFFPSQLRLNPRILRVSTGQVYKGKDNHGGIRCDFWLCLRFGAYLTLTRNGCSLIMTRNGKLKGLMLKGHMTSFTGIKSYFDLPLQPSYDEAKLNRFSSSKKIPT